MKLPKARKLKSGSWFIQLRLDGVSVPVTASTERDCINQARAIKAEYKNGKKIEKTEKTAEPTIEKLIETYIESRKAVLSPSTIAGYQTIRTNRFAAYKDKRPSDIKNWQAVINDETKTGITAKTLKNSWALLAASLEYSGIKAPAVKLPQILQKPRPWLDSEQIKIFVNAVKDTDIAIPALLGLHSLRRSEILGLTWEKIDLDNNVIHIEGSCVPDEKNRLVFRETNKTKNSRRIIPIMIPELKTALLAIPEEKRKGRLYNKYQNTLWRDINKLCEDNGLPKIGVHGLRHSFASLAHSVGLPEQDTMLIGGWEDAQTMHKIYEHISAADRLKSENKIAEFFKNANENANESQEAQ